MQVKRKLSLPLLSPSFLPYLNVGVEHRPEHDYEFLPVLDAWYKINDAWTSRATTDDFGLAYRLNKSWELFAEHRYMIEEYEISTGGQVGRTLLYQNNASGVGGLCFRCVYSAFRYNKGQKKKGEKEGPALDS